ncbi:hypothetical protein C8R46DRAFT_432482 [Mycena filopes]|nr:hypothetical protein C8R46DRAFT_432482 [Mycena filopes]
MGLRATDCYLSLRRVRADSKSPKREHNFFRTFLPPQSSPPSALSPAVDIWPEKFSLQNMPKAICPAAPSSKRQGEFKFRYCLPCACGKKVISNNHWTSVKQYCKVCEAATEKLEEEATIQPCNDAQTECANLQASSSAIPTATQTHAFNGPATATATAPLEAFLVDINLTHHLRLFVARRFADIEVLRALGTWWSEEVFRNFLWEHLGGQAGLSEEELVVVVRAIRAL